MPDQTSIPQTTEIEKELQSARKKLLDLTMRNRLLNFRTSRARTIKIIDEDPSAIYDILVHHEKSMQLLSRSNKPEQTQKGADQLQGQLFTPQEPEITGQETSAIWQLPPEAEFPDHQKDLFLQTVLESEVLQQRLFYIFQDSKSVLEELGYSTLYLATAFLEWTESEASLETRLAPLVLIPVELERSGVRAAFRLKWNGEDITTNISLKEFLLQQEIKLPDFEMPDTLDGVNYYLKEVLASILSRPKWKILNEIYLGFFSFTKFIMYKDIDPAAWPQDKSPAGHPLIQAIFGSYGDRPADAGFQENEVDNKLKSLNLYHVLDADPSQIAVIEDVKAGRNLAVEGPPGTGKSQTIVNIIAELMAAHKSVLFVSEKMAALEVVKNRLDNAGLGDFCLELHSRKSNKREFLTNLERTLAGPLAKPAVSETEYAELEGLKQILNRYAEDLRKPFGPVQLSPYALFHQKEEARCFFEKHSKSVPRIKIENAAECSNAAYDEARKKLREIQAILPLVTPLAGHPWAACSPAVILPAHEENIKESLENCLVVLDTLQTQINNLVELCAVRPPETLNEIPATIDAAAVIANSSPVDHTLLVNADWNKPNLTAQDLIARVIEFQKMRDQAISKYKSGIPDLDINALLKEFENLSGQFFKVFSSAYHRTKRRILLMYCAYPHLSDIKIIEDLEWLAKCLSLRKALQMSETRGKACFGSLWRGEKSEAGKLQAFSAWIIYFRQNMVNKVLTERSVNIVEQGVSQEKIEKTADELKISNQKLIDLLKTLGEQVGADYDAIFGKSVINVSFAGLLSHLKLWKSGTAGLQRWSQYIAVRNQCLQTLAAPLFREIEKDSLEAAEILPCFEGNFADDLLTAVFMERPGLSSFIGSLHEHKINRFVELDKKLIIQNRQRLVQKLLQDRPGFYEGASPGSEIGILKGEFNRKRGHMPIRKLMSRAGNVIQNIKPCFMMSPLSIAQFLDPKTTLFDVIIYDEASQVRPEDALGALLRGNQVAVIGDTRQLPPTTFFDHLIEDSQEEDPDNTGSHIDTESILHQCKRCFPVKMLRWHYRSRHESLVAVSNREFYDNRLLLYPSPMQESEDLGLSFIHLPGTIYDRGTGQTNRMEAKFIAERAVEHYRKHPDKSLGIAAFNIRQQQAILEEIEHQLRQNPEMEESFKSDRFEHFFVKNLETIQGDERDVIFISIGYGFDKYGKMTLNFGPLNNEGGERRLNVLITRAREKCLVFSNFKARELQLDASAPRGLSVLKLFLDFAENHVLDAIAANQDIESPFEDSVYTFLKESGYEVRKQVGCAGFRVDIAVINPSSPGQYLLGIECDGAKYHMSPVARDRDRLRQQILENLNWHIYRVWSTDWYRNRRECREKLLEAIEKREKETNSPVEIPAGPAEGIPPAAEKPVEQKVVETEASAGLKTPQDTVIAYKICENFLSDKSRSGAGEPDGKFLAPIVTRIVETEGPVHFEEVVRRVRSFLGLNRTSVKFRDTVSEAVVLAVKNQLVREQGEFLWPAKEFDVKVRRRSGHPPPNIELICDDEIVAAIELVLKTQYATLPNELGIQASRLLGIKATSEKSSRRIGNLIKNLIEEHKLEKLPNGMINFTDRKKGEQ